MARMTKNDIALYFSALVDACGRTQDEIARDAGIESSNMISMMKSGRTKIPLTRIPALAKALDADAGELFGRALEAYDPELHAVFAEVAPAMLISTKEFRIIEALRAVTSVR